MMDPADIKWVGAAWKMRALDGLDPIFREPMTPDEFRRVFTWWTHQNFGIYGLGSNMQPELHGVGIWTILAKSKRGETEPIGFILGWVRGRVIEIGGMVWFPWASQRNIVEGTVNFFDKMRHEACLLEFAEEKDRDFFNMIARHGVIRRVGTSHEIYPGAKALVYESRT
jgi:hypothetical protein